MVKPLLANSGKVFQKNGRSFGEAFLRKFSKLVQISGMHEDYLSSCISRVTKKTRNPKKDLWKNFPENLLSHSRKFANKG